MGMVRPAGLSWLADKTVHKYYNFRLAVRAKSAPSGSFSSTRLSPRRLSSGDCFSTRLIVQQGIHICSDLELPSADNPCSSQTSPERFVASSEHSPLQTPTPQSLSRTFCTRTVATPATHPKLSLDFIALWPEVNRFSSVQPLPRPPVAAVSIPSPGSHQVWKSEVSSMSSQWQKGRLVGEGTFGKVYAATHRVTGASRAMKEVTLSKDDNGSDECRRQLEQEIKVLSQLKHQNIVQYYGSEIIGDHFCIYLEYVNPGSVRTYIDDNGGALTESIVRNFTRHTLCGLEYLHQAKIVHRDIKARNLLVNADGVVKLVDFGLAKYLSGQAAQLSLKGSAYWMAPEVIDHTQQKGSEYGSAVDIWSLGCTIIEMFTGKAPWVELEPQQAMFATAFTDKTLPIPETLSAEGKDFLRLCLKKDPAARACASALLKHPFVNDSNHQEVPSCVQGSLRTKAMVEEAPKEAEKPAEEAPKEAEEKKEEGAEKKEEENPPQENGGENAAAAREEKPAEAAPAEAAGKAEDEEVVLKNEEIAKRAMYWPPMYEINRIPAPQLFSDENPNACCIL